MITTIMKWAAIAALVIGIFWRMSFDHLDYLNFVITVGAVLVVAQAAGLRKYWWAVAFVAIACLFNPILPIELSFKVLVGLQIMSAAIFASSLQFLHTEPTMTIASITEANPRTESL
jgi:uncharacterized protein DUF6804